MPWVNGGYGNWHGHVIVCGLHGVGLRIVELLNPGQSGTTSVSSTSGPPPRWPRRGSSAPRSGWTC